MKTPSRSFFSSLKPTSIPTVVAQNGKVAITFFSLILLQFFSPGFTAIVNKQLSAKYETLVDKAPELIKVLPWGPDFEVDVFRKPDFTALEVVTFATGGKKRNCCNGTSHSSIPSGMPAGINVRLSFLYMPVIVTDLLRRFL